jgi:hypothetical protein
MNVLDALEEAMQFRLMHARRFPPPWLVEEIGAAFVVKDSSGQKLGRPQGHIQTFGALPSVPGQIAKFSRVELPNAPGQFESLSYRKRQYCVTFRQGSHGRLRMRGGGGSCRSVDDM